MIKHCRSNKQLEHAHYAHTVHYDTYHTYVHRLECRPTIESTHSLRSLAELGECATFDSKQASIIPVAFTADSYVSGKQLHA